ncbi:protein Frey 1 [Bubalus kerabau]|uniref:protein Frey 1 n=1 Tax=Bubalus carabanensis TaxID=3119969 RepID=UPI00244EC541|nr:protein Frey 1 [Bubalus carabanensis]
MGSRFRPPACRGRGRQKPGSGTAWRMVLAMLGALHPRAGLSLFVLYLVLAAALLRPQPLRPQRAVPEEFSAPLELSAPLSGLVDDYGVRPKHPWPRGPRPLLSRAQQRKRDGPDMAEYYYDSRL